MRQHIEASNSASKYKEIITKAVCGNATKLLHVSRLIEFPKGLCPTDVLGITITKLRLTNPKVINEAMARHEPGIKISGTFEMHVWYAHNNGKSTNATRQNVKFEEVIPVTELDKGTISLVDAKVDVIKSPECLGSTITKDNKIKIDVELGVYAEIIGETKVSVCIYKPNGEEDDD